MLARTTDEVNLGDSAATWNSPNFIAATVKKKKSIFNFCVLLLAKFICHYDCLFRNHTWKHCAERVFPKSSETFELHVCIKIFSV